MLTLGAWVDFDRFETNKFNLIMNAVSILRAIHDIYESHDGGTIRLTVEEEDAIVKLIQKGQNLPMHGVSSNRDNYLEKINDIMWNSCMIKDRDFGRKEGFKIMQVLEEWATHK